MTLRWIRPREGGATPAALSAGHTVKPFGGAASVAAPTGPPIPESMAFAAVAVSAPWGSDHEVTESETRALDILEWLWAAA